MPVVVKADGLAAGKGVIVCATEARALEPRSSASRAKREFGDAGDQVVIEERLTAKRPASWPSPTARPSLHAAARAGPQGGLRRRPRAEHRAAWAPLRPAPVVDRLMLPEDQNEHILVPTVHAMAAEGRPYKGVLYAGLMITNQGREVLEYNVRFGDPECQPLLMRMQTRPAGLLMQAVIDGRLDQSPLMEIDDRASVCVVMASAGYPGSYPKGLPIKGLDAAKKMQDVMVFHAGTKLAKRAVVTDGGRVLGVTALGDTVADAIAKAYEAVGKIDGRAPTAAGTSGRRPSSACAGPPRSASSWAASSDLPVMEEAAAMLKKFGIPFEMTVASAHRSPERAMAFATGARERGMKVIIAGAGHAAHLAGVLAAHTILPVIGVPIDSSSLQGLDSLLSTVQMPPGIPVATMALGKSGARNAGIFAAQMLALSDPGVAAAIHRFKKTWRPKLNAKPKSSRTTARSIPWLFCCKKKACMTEPRSLPRILMRRFWKRPKRGFTRSKTSANTPPTIKRRAATSFCRLLPRPVRSAIMDQSLKRNITFASHNLVTDGVFGEMHLIFCRNVLIYFDKTLQNRVLGLFADSLNYGGFLCLGSKETLQFSDVADQFQGD